jgi:class III poly(R)-hydroxyalkanoic acid synthase PhaE subunit
MTDAGEKNEDWARAWIDEQREKLKSGPSGQGEASGKPDFAALWAQLGTAWLSGYEQVLRAGLPGSSTPLGWAREHEQAWRDLAAAQAEYSKLEAELVAKLVWVQSQALDRLERSIRDRTQESRPFKEVRELYDHWIECGEEVYAELARSEEYCQLQAALGNASVRLRAQQQKILERGLKHFDLPTRAEVNALHREVRELRARLAAADASSVKRAPKAKRRGTSVSPRASSSKRKRK